MCVDDDMHSQMCATFPDSMFDFGTAPAFEPINAGSYFFLLLTSQPFLQLHLSLTELHPFVMK